MRATITATSLCALFAMVLGLAVLNTTASAALIAYYPLNGNLNDASGHGNTGTGASGVAYAVGGGIVSDGVSTNEYFTSPVNPNSYSQITFGAWVEANPAVSNPTREIITADQGGYNRTIDIDNRGTGNGYSAFTGSGVIGGSILPSNGSFDFVAATYNTGTGMTTLDVNGNFVTSNNTPGLGGATDFLTIGRSLFYDSPFGGIIKDVFVFNTALTPDQLNFIQHNGVLAPSRRRSSFWAWAPSACWSPPRAAAGPSSSQSSARQNRPALLGRFSCAGRTALESKVHSVRPMLSSEPSPVSSDPRYKGFTLPDA